MVAGIDVPKLDANFEADAADCIFPDGDLENLSHFLQAYYHLPTYLTPFLVGYGSGAALGLRDAGASPRRHFCRRADARILSQREFAQAALQGFGNRILLAARGSRVRVLAGEKARESVGPPAEANATEPVRRRGRRLCIGDFIASTPGAALVGRCRRSASIRAVGHGLPLPGRLRYVGEAHTARLAAALPAGLADLPVIEVPRTPGTARRGLVRHHHVGRWRLGGARQGRRAALTAHGIPVVGLDSLRYFWSARTPEGLAADTDRMIRYYLAHLGKKRVLLIGYSQGADVLPFAVNRLPAATRARVALTALMGMSEHALFEFHVSSWISDGNSGPATLPEVNRITRHTGAVHLRRG